MPKYSSLVEQAKSLLRTDSDEATRARFVDFGVEIRIVAKDYEVGIIPPGTALPPLVQVGDPIHIGGRYDTLTKRFVGPCRRWTVWLVGEKQAEILFSPPTQHNLFFSAEGAGKTVLASMCGWKAIIEAAVDGISGALGAVAPTAKRLGSLLKAFCGYGRVSSSREPLEGAWGTLYSDDGEIQTVTGHIIQFRSTQKASAATGNPVQGYTWNLGAIVDEAQDVVEQGGMDDVYARLRGGLNPPIFGTCTAKDSAIWRTWRKALDLAYWTVHRFSYLDTPFVHDSHWAMMKANLSEREWARRGLALDVKPEKATYPKFSRDRHLLRGLPLGARDVTRQVLHRHGDGFEALLGHDPGSLQNVTEICKAYQVGKERRHRWIVVDEFRTESTTSDEHAAALKEYLQAEWGLMLDEGPKVLIRCDPYGTTDSKTHRNVYKTFRRYGFDIRSAAYRNGKGNGVVPKEAGIEVINALLWNAAQETWLYILADAKGRPAAPLLVESMELSERDELGRAEQSRKQRKGPSGDLSDPTAAARYMLWLEERPKGGPYSDAEERPIH